MDLTQTIIVNVAVDNQFPIAADDQNGLVSDAASYIHTKAYAAAKQYLESVRLFCAAVGIELGSNNIWFDSDAYSCNVSFVIKGLGGEIGSCVTKQIANTFQAQRSNDFAQYCDQTIKDFLRTS